MHAACLASLGHQVIGIDTDTARVTTLNTAKAPFYEPGLDDMLESAIAAGNLRFSTDIAQAGSAQVHYLGVGTPQARDGGAADTSYLDAALEALLPVLSGTASQPVVIAGKSTVPVGTAARLATRIEAEADHAVLVWNPEFLREGTAIADTLHPDRTVYGLPPQPGPAAAAVQVLEGVFGSTADHPVIHTDFATAELVKVAANGFLATKVSFINAMARLCDATGANVTELAGAIGLDERIGAKFLRAGVGYGGGCLPKDVRALIARADELDESDAVGFLREVDALNTGQRERLLEQAVSMLDGRIAGTPVAVLGASFKPDSDDLRDSPALAVAQALADQGMQVRITDPQASDAVRRTYPTLQVTDTIEHALQDVELVLLLTEWPQYVALDPVQARQWVRSPRILDGRNALDIGRWREAGWHYQGVGRR